MAQSLHHSLRADDRPKVVAFIRVSTEGQAADGRGGMDRQREVVKRILSRENLTCLHTYELIDTSGSDVWAHPSMKEVLGLLLDRKIAGVVSADLDRILRPTTSEGFSILEVFRETNAKIYAGDQTYDFRTKDGVLFSSIRGAIAGFELSLIKERQQGAMEAIRKAGGCPTNHLTFPTGIGYDRKAGAWHYTSEISKVKELFRLYEEGVRNYSELGRRVNMGPATVKVILRNPVYTGERVLSQKRGAKRVSASGKIYRQKVGRPDEDIIRVKILEGIISAECFKRVQTEMKRTAFNHLDRLKNSGTVNLGAGLLVCGHCGNPLFYVSGRQAGQRTKRSGFVQCKSRHYVYKQRMGGCKQANLRTPDVEQAIQALGTMLLSKPSNIEKILAGSAARKREKVYELPASATPSAKADELKKRDVRVLAAYEGGAISLEELREKREAIRKEMAFLAQLETRAVQPKLADHWRLVRAAIKGAARFPKLNDKHLQKRILNELLDEVHVRDQEIVSFRFKETVLPELTTGGTILLPNPLIIGTKEEALPAGFRRCIKCSAVKADSEFYKQLNSCDPCRKAADRARFIKRREESRQIKAGPSP